MKYILAGAQVFIENCFLKRDVFIDDGYVVDISPSLSSVLGVTVFKFNNYFIFPGLVDVHVHLREPGFSYKETIFSGTLAAARGGYTSICTMPNLSPAPDNMEHLQIQQDIIDKSANVHVYPYATITKGQEGEVLSDMEALTKKVVGFSDDGVGVQNGSLMREAMEKAHRCGKIIVAHCEDNKLKGDGYIHDGEYAKLHNHRGISSESEWVQIERDIEMVRETGCCYHVCHISTKESVEKIRRAKADGIDITCETAPHYLTLNDMDLREDGRFKMNPPIRSEDDRNALIEGILDGTIDMIATDHAPHSAEEKNRGLRDSLMGVVGLETAFPILYTKLVKSGVITLEKLIELMQKNPAKRFEIGTKIEKGQVADLTVFSLDEKFKIDPKTFLSKGKSTPFEGEEVFGKCKMTIVKGKIVWQENSIEK